MTADFWIFSKRINSTKLPNTDSITVDVKLKSPTSLENPVLLVQTDVHLMTYAKFNETYFWVEDVVSTQGLWEVHLAIDVLASYRTEVLATKAYVAYCGSTFDANLPDDRIAVTSKQRTARVDVGTGSVFDAGNGSFVLCVLGDNGQTFGGFTSMFGMSPSQIWQLAQVLVRDQDLWTELLQFLQSPYDSIVSLKWVPVKLEQVASLGSAASINLGAFNVSTVTGWKLFNTVVSGGFEVSIPWLYNDWRDAPPYTTGTLYLPLVGNVELQLGDCYGENSIVVDYNVDVASGDCVYKVRTGVGNKIIQTISCNIATNIPIGQTVFDAGSMLGGAVTAIGGVVASVATGGLGGLAVAAGGLSKAALAGNARGVSVAGNYSGRAGAASGVGISLQLFGRDLAEQPQDVNGVMGRPCGRVLQLSGVTGYCQTVGASVQAQANKDHLQEINGLLDGGVYIE